MHDDVLKKMDAVSKSEVSQLIKDFNAERALLTTKLEKAKAAAVEGLQTEHAALVEALEAR